MSATVNVTLIVSCVTCGKEWGRRYLPDSKVGECSAASREIAATTPRPCSCPAWGHNMQAAVIKWVPDGPALLVMQAFEEI